MVSFTVTYTITIDKLTKSTQVTRESNDLIEPSSLTELQEEINKLKAPTEISQHKNKIKEALK